MPTPETVNPRDPFAVAVLKDEAIVGHVSRKVSSICSLFLRRNGSISCRVTRSRRYSEAGGSDTLASERRKWAWLDSRITAAMPGPVAVCIWEPEKPTGLEIQYV